MKKIDKLTLTHSNSEPNIQKCIRVGDTVDEFAGRVKVVVVDPPEDDQYSKRKSEAAFIALANMMIGVNTFIIVLFTMGFKLECVYTTGHIVLCTVGYQFCMPLGILMVNSLYGPAVPLKKWQRRTDHVLLHLLGLILTGVGYYLLHTYRTVTDKRKPPDTMMTPHFYSGCGAGGAAVLNMLFGLCLLRSKKELKSPGCLGLTHRFLGILAFLSSSTCFILGILRPTIQSWLFFMGYMSPVYLIVFFTIFYTLAILSAPGSKFVLKPNKQVI